MRRSRFYWGMILFAFSALLVGQAAPECTVTENIHVIDADGKDVGILVSTPKANPSGSDGYKIFEPSQNTIYTILPWNGEVQVPVENDIYFLTSDCTGQVYVTSPHPLEEIIKALDDYYRITSFEKDLIYHSKLGSGHGCIIKTVPAKGWASGIEPLGFPFPPSHPAPLHLEIR